jgi:Fe-S-cluster-containing hydrogenase component 2
LNARWPVNAIAIDAQTQAKVIMRDLCIGCHLCTLACPFGTVYTLPHSGKATKCNLCGGDPACAKACPTAAVEFEEQEVAGAWFGPWADTVDQNYRQSL